MKPSILKKVAAVVAIAALVAVGVFGVLLVTGSAVFIAAQFTTQEEEMGYDKDCEDGSCPAPLPEKAKVTNAVASRYNGDLIPKDGCQYFSVFLLGDNWQADAVQRHFMSLFYSNPRLHQMMYETQTRIITPSQRAYWAKSARTGASFASVSGQIVPTFILQDCNGSKAFKVSGANLPNTGDELADAIQAETSRVRPNRQVTGRSVNSYRMSSGQNGQSSGLFTRTGLFRRPCPNNVQEPPPAPVPVPMPTQTMPQVRDDFRPPQKSGAGAAVAVIVIMLILGALFFIFVLCVMAAAMSFLVNSVRNKILKGMK